MDYSQMIFSELCDMKENVHGLFQAADLTIARMK